LNVLFHQLEKETTPDCGDRACRPIFSKSVYQTSHTTTHEISRWLMVPGA